MRRVRVVRRFCRQHWLPCLLFGVLLILVGSIGVLFVFMFLVTQALDYFFPMPDFDDENYPLEKYFVSESVLLLPQSARISENFPV